MKDSLNVPSLAYCLEMHNIDNVTRLMKESTETTAWFAATSGLDLFLKLYPHESVEPRSAVEIAIAGANLHPSIISLRQIVPCREGTLLLYDRARGENLGLSETRHRFQALSLAERTAAVSAVFGALTSIGEAGFMIVDWYEGNMIYDFSQKQIWLFDWDLCRKGDGFTLEKGSNYGSSRVMAPEEFIRGSWLDQRTIVFNLGRYSLLTMPELANALAPILARATYPAQSQRYPSIREFTQAFAKATPQEAVLNLV